MFPFGYGLSYTKFAYSGLKVAPDAKSVSFEVRNTGARAGDEIAEVYVTLPDSAGSRSASWRVEAGAAGRGGEADVEVAIDPLYLSVYSVEKDAWSRPEGMFVFEVGGSAADCRCVTHCIWAASRHAAVVARH